MFFKACFVYKYEKTQLFHHFHWPGLGEISRSVFISLVLEKI
ncbi:hypothetical protein Hanom_Chr09g00771801 [Helianthus anomalus]